MYEKEYNYCILNELITRFECPTQDGDRGLCTLGKYMMVKTIVNGLAISERASTHEINLPEPGLYEISFYILMYTILENPSIGGDYIQVSVTNLEHDFIKFKHYNYENLGKPNAWNKKSFRFITNEQKIKILIDFVRLNPTGKQGFFGLDQIEIFKVDDSIETANPTNEQTMILTSAETTLEPIPTQSSEGRSTPAENTVESTSGLTTLTMSQSESTSLLITTISPFTTPTYSELTSEPKVTTTKSTVGLISTHVEINDTSSLSIASTTSSMTPLISTSLPITKISSLTTRFQGETSVITTLSSTKNPIVSSTNVYSSMIASNATNGTQFTLSETTTSQNKTDNKNRLIYLIVIPVVVSVFLLTLVGFCYKKCKSKNIKIGNESKIEEIDLQNRV